jgi:hypothetical protein
LAVVAVGVVALLSAAAVAVPALRDISAGVDAFTAARAALLRPDATTARQAFDRAGAAFAATDQRLRSALALPFRTVPVVRNQLDAVDAIARASAMAAHAGSLTAEALAAGPPEGWGLKAGAVDIPAVSRAASILSGAVATGREAIAELRSGPSSGVLAPVAAKVREADDRLSSAVDGLTKAQIGAQSIGSLLGAGGQRRYLVAFANRAEMRGTGGFIGFLTMVEARNGRLTVLAHSGRPAESLPPPSSVPLRVPSWYVQAHGQTYGATKIWPNINTSADFPTVGSEIVQVASSAVGPVDGVIQVDAAGIAALLSVTGPVRIPLWPVPVTADNVATIVEHDEYVTYADRNIRTQMIDELITTVFNEVLSTKLSLNASTVQVLGDGAAAHHFEVFSIHPADEAAMRTLGVDGGVARVGRATDVLGVYTENASANKADWFLRRTVSYGVLLHPDDGSAETTLRVAIANGAPTNEPTYIVGPNTAGLRAGDDRQIVMIVRSPADQLDSFSLNGAAGSMTELPEASLRAYHGGGTIGPGSVATIVSTSTIPNAVVEHGQTRSYRLYVLRQPVAAADNYDIRLNAARGWEIDGPSVFHGPVDHDIVLDVMLRKPFRSRFVDVLFAGPYRAARGLLRRLF